MTNTSGSVSIANSGGNQTIAVPVVLGSNLAVSVTSGSNLTISGPISETSPGKTVVLGGGLLILSGSNTYTGGTTVSGGTLDFASPAALPS